MKKRLICGLLAVVCVFNVVASVRESISLAGEWKFQADPGNVGLSEEWFNKDLSDTIQLPGSTDEQGYGDEQSYEDVFDTLIRKHFYIGKAWYQKEVTIPDEWLEKRVVLFLERCHWVTEVWVDGQLVGSKDSLCVPHEYDLTAFLKPGKHCITICVNNKPKFNLGSFSSSISKHTQTNWNGIIGKIELQATDRIWIDDIQIYPNIKNQTAKVRFRIKNCSKRREPATFIINVAPETGGRPEKTMVAFVAEEEGADVETIVAVGDDVILWDEFNPVLYKMDVRLMTAGPSDRISVLFGMRELGVDGQHFTVNGNRVYMRGNLECCVFPLTGYPPMDEAEWIRLFKIAKSYGLNHVRYHSWCPPKAAFSAADRVGFYLQPEAPRANVPPLLERDAFVREELMSISHAYANHASFAFLTAGNELGKGGDNATESMLETLASDSRYLFTASSGGHGMEHEDSISKGNQYKIVGRFRGFKQPGTVEDHSKNMENQVVPCLSHEVGQWCPYPWLDAIDRYTGVLDPKNLKAIREDLKSQGLLDQYDDFLMATMKHSTLLYKEEIEVLLRTHNSAGFQLLALHDYPGQGSAHVGLVDAFWDAKGGIIKPEEFRRFCQPTVPLLRMPAREYSTNNPFVAEAEILNYGPSTLTNAQVLWTLETESGKLIEKGQFDNVTITQGKLIPLGSIKADLSKIRNACKARVTLGIVGTDIENDWEIWCYPQSIKTDFPKDVFVSEALTPEVLLALDDGAKVVILPNAETLNKPIQGQFKPVFWSPTWWFTAPRGGDVPMGILCDPNHPALADFPTDMHSNWQWWDLQNHSQTMSLDRLPKDFRPIVQVIDNYGRNRRLGNVFEANVGQGKVLVCSIDIESNLNERLAVRQLRNSLIKYVDSKQFEPKQSLTIEELAKVFKTK